MCYVKKWNVGIEMRMSDGSIYDPRSTNCGLIYFSSDIFYRNGDTILSTVHKSYPNAFNGTRKRNKQNDD